jgi:hypothetical protein
MKTILKSILAGGGLFLGAVGAWAAIASEGAGFDRYRAIINRQMFKEIATPEPAAAAAATSAPTETLTKELELRAIFDDGDRLPLRAGFLDKKTNKTFYLAVGEKNETYELVSINYESEEVLLKKGTETTLFMLRSKTNAATGGGLLTAPRTPFGFPPAAEPGRGFAPVPLSESKQPFFSNINKEKFSPFKPVGTNAPTPFQPQSLESFMRPGTNAVKGFPGQLRPFGALRQTNAMGDTIEGFMRANPNSSQRFAPHKAPDFNATNPANPIGGFFTPVPSQPPVVPNPEPEPEPAPENDPEE